jgi:hypothetical protein
MSVADLQDPSVYPPKAPADAEPIKLAIASDWGSGTMESAAVAELMAQFDAHYTMHMGDVYYESLDHEIKTAVLGEAPNEYERERRSARAKRRPSEEAPE